MPSATPAPPLFVVLNVGSGAHDTSARLQALRDVFAEAGRPHRVWSTQGRISLRAAAREAVARARAAGGAVVAAGGDGTISTVADIVLADTASAAAAGLPPLPFGALPQGTFNLFGRAHALPLDLAEGARALLDATPVPVQVGRVHAPADDLAVAFLVNASLGLYPDLLEDREAWKRRFGRSRLVAAVAGLATVLSRGLGRSGIGRLTLQLREARRAERVATLFIGNNPLQVGALGLDEAERVGQGDLVAVMLKPVGLGRLLGLAFRGALGRLGDADQVTHFAFRQLTVEPVRARWSSRDRPRPIKVALDGEIRWLRPPLRFEVCPLPLLLLKPAGAPGPAAASAPEAP